MRRSVSTIARKELDIALSHGSTAKEAVASLMARCRQDQRLYRELMDPWLQYACHNAIEQQRYSKYEYKKGPLVAATPR
jgi:hypothetical protein